MQQDDLSIILLNFQSLHRRSREIDEEHLEMITMLIEDYGKQQLEIEKLQGDVFQLGLACAILGIILIWEAFRKIWRTFNGSESN